MARRLGFSSAAYPEVMTALPERAAAAGVALDALKVVDLNRAVRALNDLAALAALVKWVRPTLLAVPALRVETMRLALASVATATTMLVLG